MKKLLIVMAFAGLISACNDSGKSDDSKKDTSNATLNAAPATLTADKSKMAADSTMKADSIKNKMDTSGKK
jgi:hypothetical protein